MVSVSKRSLRRFTILGLGVVGALFWWWAVSAPETRLDNQSKPEVVGTKRKSAMMASVRSVPPAMAEQGQALEHLMAGEPFVLMDNEQPRRFRLSLKEVYLPAAAAGQRLRQVKPQPDARSLVALAEQMAGEKSPGWVLYPEDGEGIPALRRVLHTQILVKVANRGAAFLAMEQAGLRILDEPDYAPGYVIAEVSVGGPAAALEAMAALGKNAAFETVSPLLLHQNAKKSLPDDTYFNDQWHLRNTGQKGGKVGSDVNVTSVWDTFQGEGIRIGIVDDGLEILHPDLAANADVSNHYDWNDSPKDTDPAPNVFAGDNHGTSVGGVSAARGGNGIGVSGVAPRATLVGFRLISELTTDAEDAEAMTRGNNVIQVKNNSWGHADGYPWILEMPGPLFNAARQTAALQGRGGRGTILVWAAGNGRAYGDEGNKDSASNSMYSVVVGGIGNTGKLTTYSEIGAHLAVVAPTSDAKTGIATTDLRGGYGYNKATVGELPDVDYTNGFGGTSSAAPAAAGVIALILQANPNLGWRDVKEILLRSATKIFPTTIGWVSRTGGDDPALPPIKHHHSYGGGLVNAQAAVELALDWTNLGPMIQESRPSSLSISIPDNNKIGVSIPFDFINAQPLRVENVTVRLNAYHSYRGDLEVTLRSPGGVTSTLASKQKYDDGSGYAGWVFSSMRHWGESASGTWSLTIKDLASGDTGGFQSATVTLYGSSAPAVQITSQSATSLLLEEGQSLALHVNTTGYGKASHQWRRGTALVSTSGGNYDVEAVSLAHAGIYQDTITNLTGSALSAAMPVGVVRRQMSPITANEGSAFTLKAFAAGPGVTFQWLRDDEPLEDITGHISGAQRDTLKVSNAGADDVGAYVCRVTLPGGALPMDTQPAVLTLRYRPVVTGPPFSNGVVSGVESFQFVGDSGPTKYAAAGVPAGMTFNTKTGLLSGRPTKAGTYTIKVTATNAAGTGQAYPITWTVEEFPLAARGSFNGLVERETVLNGDFGGRFNLLVTNGGTFSGKITLGAKSYSLTGRVNALPGNADPSIDLSIARAKPLLPLTSHLTLSLADGTLAGSLNGDGGSVNIFARRSPWSSANATAAAGTYNAVLEFPEELSANADYPQGNGYAALTVAPAGTVVWAGRLSDGTSLTGSTTMALDGQISLHLMLYANTGSVQGWSVLNTGTGMVDGALGWSKNRQPDKSTTRSYKGGFGLHELTLAGARYNKPAPASIVTVFSPPAPDENNAKLTFTSGGLVADLVQDFSITTANAVKMPTRVDLNPQAVKLTLNAATGAFSGSFVFKDEDPTDSTAPIAVITRKATFNGLLIVRSGYNRGIGQFLLPALPTLDPKTTPATSPIGSGLVTLEPAP